MIALNQTIPARYEKGSQLLTSLKKAMPDFEKKNIFAR